MGDSPLHCAVADSSIETVKALIDAGAHVNARNEYGMTPLLKASTKCTLSLVKILIEAGAEVNVQDRAGETPLHLFTKHDNKDVIEYLIAAGADVNAKDGRGDSLLHCAVADSSIETVKTLIDAGANVNARNRRGETPLFLCIDYGMQNFAVHLIKAGADVNFVDKNGISLLHLAVKNINSGIVVKYKEYFQFDLNPVQTEKSTVEILVEAGANVNGNGKFGESPLHLAVSYNKIETVKVLVEAGANVNARNSYGLTPLLLCITQKNENFAIPFLKAGADVNAKDESGYTPLRWAIINKVKMNVIMKLIIFTVLCNDDLISVPEFIQWPSRLCKFWNLCSSQVKKMRMCTINGKSVPLRSFLSERDTDKLILFLGGKNISFEDFVKDNPHIEEFSVYQDVIKSQLYKANEWFDLLRKSNIVMRHSSLVKLPVKIRRLIAGLCSDFYLKILIKSATDLFNTQQTK